MPERPACSVNRLLGIAAIVAQQQDGEQDRADHDAASATFHAGHWYTRSPTGRVNSRKSVTMAVLVQPVDQVAGRAAELEASASRISQSPWFR